MIDRILRWHCRLFHRSISRPIRGKYECWKCQRIFRVGW